MKASLLFIAYIVLLTSCNNSPSPDSKAEKSQADSLFDEVMEEHNIGMAKMSSIREAQKEIQQQIDSISKLPTNAQGTASAYKMRLDSVSTKLSQANDLMDKWMTEFNMDSAKNDEEKRIEYLKSEKIKITTVKDAMIGSLQTADSLLKRRP